MDPHLPWLTAPTNTKTNIQYNLLRIEEHMFKYFQIICDIGINLCYCNMITAYQEILSVLVWGLYNYFQFGEIVCRGTASVEQ